MQNAVLQYCSIAVLQYCSTQYAIDHTLQSLTQLTYSMLSAKYAPVPKYPGRANRTSTPFGSNATVSQGTARLPCHKYRHMASPLAVFRRCNGVCLDSLNAAHVLVHTNMHTHTCIHLSLCNTYIYILYTRAIRTTNVFFTGCKTTRSARIHNLVNLDHPC